MELVGSTQQRLDVLEQSIARMSSQAEQHGAVQQVRRSCLTLSVVIRQRTGGRSLLYHNILISRHLLVSGSWISITASLCVGAVSSRCTPIFIGTIPIYTCIRFP